MSENKSVCVWLGGGATCPTIDLCINVDDVNLTFFQLVHFTCNNFTTMLLLLFFKCAFEFDLYSLTERQLLLQYQFIKRSLQVKEVDKGRLGSLIKNDNFLKRNVISS